LFIEGLTLLAILYIWSIRISLYYPCLIKIRDTTRANMIKEIITTVVIKFSYLCLV